MYIPLPAIDITSEILVVATFIIHKIIFTENL